MKYDDAAWHYEGREFDLDLPHQAGATHIAMFVLWAWLNGLGANAFADLARQARERIVTPGVLFKAACGEVFTSEHLNSEGNQFAETYYADERDFSGFSHDFSEAFPEINRPYGHPDTWETFDRVAPLLSQRLEEWRTGQLGT